MLIAGSKSWLNYRHQADVFHAYQLLRRNNFPDDRITLIAYDDIADNAQNPFQGQVFNYNGGPNVYPGANAIDVSGDNVTPSAFLNVRFYILA